MKIITSYKQWVFSAFNANVNQLGLFRVLYCFFMIYVLGVPQYAERIASFPDGLFNAPPFFSLFFDQVPSLLYFQISDWIILIGFFFVFIGFFTKYFGILTSLLIIVNNGFIFSTGKIDHSFMAWFTLFILSFSGWEKAFSIDAMWRKFKHYNANNWTISLMALSIGFGFFTAGIIKLVSGWLSLKDSMLQAFFLRNYYVQEKQDFFAPLFEKLQFSAFWESGDWFTILFEIGFLFAAFNTRMFRFFTVLAVFFHGAVLFMMNIGFFTYLPLYLLFWIPLLPQSITDKIRLKLEKITQSKPMLVIVGVVFFALLFVKMYLPDQIGLVLNQTILIIAFLTALYLLLFSPSTLFAHENDKSKSGIIRFDGVCNLCNGFIQFILKRDPKNHFKFATLQQPGQQKDENFDTVVLDENGEQLEKSGAFLEIVRRLSWYWPYLYLTIWVPKFIRNIVYDFVAKNRYSFFGKQDQCMIPTPDMKTKFVESE